jgi:glycosyltransferase involved in cell wall biosynthesis
MRIAIDARKIHDFGIGTYIRNVLTELAHLDRSTEYIVLTRSMEGGTSAFGHAPAAGRSLGGGRSVPPTPGARETDLAENLGANFRLVPASAAPYSIGEQWRLPLTLAREHVDLLHEPHYVLPILTRCRSVVTIHDCIHLRFPEYLPSKLAHVYAQASMRVATRKAARLLTVSQASKRDILHFFDVPDDRIVVVPNGIDERFLRPPDAEQVDRVRQRFQLDGPFALYVGNIKPHKNVDRLIEAFSRARGRGLTGLRLIIIGDELSKYPGLRHAVHRHRLDKDVRFLGFQPIETLSVFYRLAQVFVFPSLYEGFGLPPLEAMACGTPVVTSKVSSMPEVAGGAALLVDPADADSIAEGMVRAATDQALRTDLVTRGLARAREFSWAESVRRIHAVYMEVLR